MRNPNINNFTPKGSLSVFNRMSADRELSRGIFMEEEMDKIIINKDGSRTVIGELAHKLAYGSYNVHYFKLCDDDNYRVWEVTEDKAILRATQNKEKQAVRYMKANRVLVCDLRK